MIEDQQVHRNELLRQRTLYPHASDLLKGWFITVPQSVPNKYSIQIVSLKINKINAQFLLQKQ